MIIRSFFTTCCNIVLSSMLIRQMLSLNNVGGNILIATIDEIISMNYNKKISELLYIRCNQRNHMIIYGIECVLQLTEVNRIFFAHN